MASSPEKPSKRDVTRALLARGSCFVHLDPRVEGVHVPEDFGRQPQLVLQIGLDMPVPIPDLRVDDDGIFATLSFNRAPFSCSVAWRSVYALVGEDGSGVVWAEDIPSEIADEVEREARRRRPLTLGRIGPREGTPAAGIAASSGKPSNRRTTRKKTLPVPATALADRKDSSNGRGSDPAGDPPAAAPVSVSGDSTTAHGNTSRPKRELPPYLRVVK